MDENQFSQLVNQLTRIADALEEVAQCVHHPNGNSSISVDAAVYHQ